MPIIYNGETFSNGGSATVDLGDGDVNVTEIYASVDGSDPVQVWIRAITCTDLVNWNGWATGGLVNQSGEGTAGAYTGIQCVSGTSTGRANGSISQNISMVNGHVYWLYYGIYSMNGFTVATPLGNRSFGSGTSQVNELVTYTGTSGSQGVNAYYSGSDNTGSAYGRLCNMNIVDLTASFGAGNEPTAQWCATNLGIFNGSKTIIP